MMTEQQTTARVIEGMASVDEAKPDSTKLVPLRPLITKPSS